MLSVLANDVVAGLTDDNSSWKRCLPDTNRLHSTLQTTSTPGMVITRFGFDAVYRNVYDCVCMQNVVTWLVMSHGAASGHIRARIRRLSGV